eukprot:GDKH01006666.1.p2 GENE.GDKH01006666.1~~GDKH01006666.1.p2  ORF type:complete len:73 (-),score=3.46 GDKH01006666.1:118-336(-)
MGTRQHTLWRTQQEKRCPAELALAGRHFQCHVFLVSKMFEPRIINFESGAWRMENIGGGVIRYTRTRVEPLP